MENISKNLLFFGTDDKNSFDSYQLIDKKEGNSFQNILIYNISKKVKEIDKKGKKALLSLSRLLFNTLTNQEERVAYKSLDTFLVSTPAFRKRIRGLDATELETLKRTVISSMIEKIYDNITKDRGVSNLRFALVLLKDGLHRADNNLQSHIFYDIQNGVNINREVEKNFTQKIREKELTQEIEPYSRNPIESLLKKDDEKRFINSLLKTLLSMHSFANCDIKKIAILVSYMCYIVSTEDIKITKKNGVEKIGIAHSFMSFVEYQAKYNSLNFILMLDEFLEKRENQKIEEFLNRRVSIEKNSLTIKDGTLRQKNLKFLNNLLIVGDFLKLISKERCIESIIYSIQKKVLEKSIDTKEYSKEPISSSFLKLFAKEYRKKECQQRLKEFFESFRKHLLLQKKPQQRSISYSVALTSHQ
jgi:hypothetical protein